jgi:hypothetical protein
MLAADATEIAVFNRRPISELTRPEFLLDVPMRIPITRRIAEGALQRCDRTIESAFAPARDVGESILGSVTKSFAVGDVKWTR